MTYRVVYSGHVQEQISAHVAYLKSRGVSVDRIEQWWSQVFELIDSLYAWPERFPVSEEQSRRANCEIRKAGFGDYLIFYRIDHTQQRVEVLSFWHGARDSGETTA